MTDAAPNPVPLSAAPAAKQLVTHENQTYTTIREGSAYILVPPQARTAVDPRTKKFDDGSQVQNVFYNPIQQFNRDLSVLAIKAFGEDSCQRKAAKHEGQRGRREKKADGKKKRKREAEGEGGEGLHGREEKVRKGGAETNGASVGEEVGAAQAAQEAATDEAREAADPAKGNRAVDHSQEAEAGTTVQTTDAEGQDDGSGTAQPHVKACGNSTGATASTQTHANGHGDNIGGVPRAEEEDQHHVATAHQTPAPWKPRFRILDALSATGLRALRYASEIPFATAVVANDRDRNAVRSIGMNAEHNKLSEQISATAGDAIGLMYSVAYPPPHSHGPQHINGRFDVIDLDPYGTAAPFIDAALQALDDGGLLCVTCTDSGVFASCGYSEKTFALYGGMPVKGNHCHEGGLRLVLNSIATTASKYGIAIEPLLSLSIDFYVRLFIRVRKSPADVKFLAGKTMISYECDHGCGAWSQQYIGRHARHKNSDVNWKYSIAQAPTSDRLCEHCGSKMHLSGPMWGGPLHNAAFVEKLLDDLDAADPEIYQTKQRMEGMLTTALDELVVLPKLDEPSKTAASTGGRTEIIPRIPPQQTDPHPFYFFPSALCKVIKAQAPAEDLLRGALRHAGYAVTRSHCRPGSIKTDAPWPVIWEVIREWVRQRSPIKEGAVKEGQAGWKILQAMRKDDVETEDGEKRDWADRVENEGDERTRDLKSLKVVFDAALGRDKPSKKRLVRYQQNPRENWGPMVRAKGSA